MAKEPEITEKDLDLLEDAKDTLCDFCSGEDCGLCPAPRILERMRERFYGRHCSPYSGTNAKTIYNT